MLSIRFANGEILAIDSDCTLGRGKPACWSDSEISREHVRVCPVEDCPSLLLLENIGLNPVVVEETMAASASGSWEIKDFLDRGMSSLVQTGARFYILSKQDSTTAIIQTTPQPQPDAVDLTQDDAISDAIPDAKRRRVELPTGVEITRGAAGSNSGNVPPRESPFALTWVRGLPAKYNSGCFGARLRHLVAGDIQFAFVENYMVDLAWLLTCCPALLTAKKVFVVHGEHGDKQAAIQETVLTKGLQGSFTVHCPPLPISYGTHHSKAFILQYTEGLRVIIHTANLIYTDCNNKTQGLWYQDFPRKSAHSRPCDFERDLLDYLSNLRLPAQAACHLSDIVSQHDFSCARAHLVASVPGYHSGRKVNTYGHMRVRGLLGQVQLPAKFLDCKLLCQCSSLGSLDEKWLLDEFGASLAAGQITTASAQHPFGARSAPKVAGPRLGPSRLQLVWPSVEEVRNSLEGWVAGYSIPGPQKNVSKPFLRPYLCRYEGTPVGRQRAMPHIKTYCRYQGRQLAWFMVGSHNLSKAAWGTLQKGGQQLMVRSYELGALLLPDLEAAYRNSPQWDFSCTPSQTKTDSLGLSNADATNSSIPMDSTTDAGMGPASTSAHNATEGKGEDGLLTGAHNRGHSAGVTIPGHTSAHSAEGVIVHPHIPAVSKGGNSTSIHRATPHTTEDKGGNAFLETVQNRVKCAGSVSESRGGISTTLQISTGGELEGVQNGANTAAIASGIASGSGGFNSTSTQSSAEGNVGTVQIRGNNSSVVASGSRGANSSVAAAVSRVEFWAWHDGVGHEHVTSISNDTDVSNIGNVSTISNIGNIGNIGNISNIGNIGNISNIGNIGNVSDIGNISNIGGKQQVSPNSKPGVRPGDCISKGGVAVCHLPLPFPLPPRRYGECDQPWMCDVEYPGLDALGRPWGMPARYYGRVEPCDGRA